MHFALPAMYGRERVKPETVTTERERGNCLYFQAGECRSIQMSGEAPSCPHHSNHKCLVKGDIIDRQRRYRPEPIKEN